MTEEELNRKMEFIVEQQVQFTVDIQKIQEAHAQGEKRISRLEGAFVSLYNTVTKIAENQQKTDEQLKELAASNKATHEMLNEMGERLNALILVVERHVSGHSHDQNGKS